MDKRKVLRSNMPLAEVILWSRLKGKQMEGYKFRRQYSIGHFVVDFYCLALRLAIELNGDSHYAGNEQLYDTERQKQIKAYGIEVLRFTNRDICEKLEGVLLNIAERIKQITTPTPPYKGGDFERTLIKEGTYPLEMRKNHKKGCVKTHPFLWLYESFLA